MTNFGEISQFPKKSINSKLLIINAVQKQMRNYKKYTFILNCSLSLSSEDE